MVVPRHRSRSLRRVNVTTPGGRKVTHYRPRAHAPAECALCKAPLQAVMTGRAAIIGKYSKSERRPQRPFGGNMCSKCTRATIKARARA